MLSNYENKRVNRELKGILRDFADTYHSLCDVSRRARSSSADLHTGIFIWVK